MQKVCEEKINQLTYELDRYHSELLYKEQLISDANLAIDNKSKEFDDMKETMEKKLFIQDEEFRKRIEILEKENAEYLEQKNIEMDKKLKIEETIDQKNERIV